MCEACGNPVELLEWEMEQERTVGWWVHFVEGAHEVLVNAHTHNLEKKYKHQDLQIVAPIDPQVINGIFWEVINRVAKGEKFQHGDQIENILKNSPVKFALADEDGRRVLRIILPDNNGKLDREEQEEQYAWQWMGTL